MSGPYDFDAEAREVCNAIGSGNGWMTVNCALHEAYEAGKRATAPDLLEALKAMVSPVPDGMSWAQCLVEREANARRAIAKAEGAAEV